MVLLENDTFLLELTKLFQKGRASGSVMLTMKRYDGRSKPPPRKGTVPDPTEYKCLVRASLANKKISTVTGFWDKFDRIVDLAEPHIEGVQLLSPMWPDQKYIISQKDVNRFQMAYTNLLKGNMDGLKKKDKKSAKGKTKSKATQ